MYTLQLLILLIEVMSQVVDIEILRGDQRNLVTSKCVQSTVVFSQLAKAIAEGYEVVSLQGSTRSSKTYNVIMYLIITALATPSCRVSIVRGTLTSIRSTVYVDFVEILHRLGVFDQKSMNKSEMIYSLPNGSVFEFFGTDSEQKLRGRKRDILFVNEANEVNRMAWQQLRLRTSKFIILDYNPSFSEDHWISGVNEERDTKHIITTYRDNPFLEDKVISEIERLKEKNHSLWQIYGLGIRAVVEGLVFPKIELVEVIPEGGESYIGVDFGFSNDPTAVVRVTKIGMNLYIEELCYRTHLTNSELIAILKTTAGRIICESADPRLVNEIRLAGVSVVPVKKGAGSIAAGISAMSDFQICITKSSRNVIKEFAHYVYSSNRDGVFTNSPIDLYNHAIDAIRYVVLTNFLGKNKRNSIFKNAEY